MPVFQTGLDAAKLTSGPACISSQQHVPSKGVFPHIYLLVWVKRSLGIFTTISQVWWGALTQQWAAPEVLDNWTIFSTTAPASPCKKSERLGHRSQAKPLQCSPSLPNSHLALNPNRSPHKITSSECCGDSSGTEGLAVQTRGPEFKPQEPEGVGGGGTRRKPGW